MALNFDNYDVDIDVEATRRAHSRLPRTSEKCGCAGCRNFTLAIGDALGEGGRRFFTSVGIDDPAQAIGCLCTSRKRTGRSATGGGTTSAAGSSAGSRPSPT